jgi:predicted acylesterase/phospholipase RssA
MRPLARRRLFGLAAAGALSGCAWPQREPSVPNGMSTQATVLGLPNERFFPIHGVGPLEAEFEAAQERRRRALGMAPDAKLPELQLLSISGGGEDGAFGAGILCGWTETGDRPEFELVTGVSTGALTAPFAFLGPAYDAQLRQVYTGLTPDNVLRRRGLIHAVFDDALTDNAPLFQVISRFVDETMQARIAQAYNDGRMLLIASTNIDAMEAVIWNIGAIAASNHPKALQTIRRVMLASAAIPGAFPPTMFDVTVDGKPYQEMHVDGGTFAQAFLYPPAMLQQRRHRLANGIPVPPAVAYVIRNARMDPEWAQIERRTLSIAGRAISVMIAASGYNDVRRIYLTTQRDGIDYKLAYIGADFAMRSPQPFDPGYMKALFEYGFARARGGYEWSRQPPA